jgi:hypothetical protein
MYDEEFSTSHPVFQWIFRVSRNWGGIIELIPAMREQLHSTGSLRDSSPVSRSVSRVGPPPGPEDVSINYSATFRQLFCVAAHDIAKSLDTRLQDLGSLYEDVLTTGTLLKKTPLKDTHTTKNVMAADATTKAGDAEAGFANPIASGKGQLLVVTRKVGTEESNRLQNSGYLFAHLDQVSDPLARSMQVSRDDLYRLVSRLRNFCAREPFFPTQGAYLASFLLQPSPVMKGLEVIVPRDTPDRLPMVKLSSDEMDYDQLKLLSYFNGLTLDDCMVRIDQLLGASSTDDMWLEKFRDRIHELLKKANEPTLRRATFSSQQLDITHGITGQNEPSHATVFAFCGIKDVYSQALQNRDMRYIPLSFFQCLQRTYPGCPDHAIFAQRNHREFSTLFSSLEPKSPTLSSWSEKKWPNIFTFMKSGSTSEVTLSPDSSSEKGLVKIRKCASTDSSQNTSGHLFGGIMVSQNITINEDRQRGSEMELSDLGIRSEATVADKEQQTMADKLISITTSLHGRR